jgi:hypothetical protein
VGSWGRGVVGSWGRGLALFPILLVLGCFLVERPVSWLREGRTEKANGRKARLVSLGKQQRTKDDDEEDGMTESP